MEQGALDAAETWVRLAIAVTRHLGVDDEVLDDAARAKLNALWDLFDRAAQIILQCAGAEDGQPSGEVDAPDNVGANDDALLAAARVASSALGERTRGGSDVVSKGCVALDDGPMLRWLVAALVDDFVDVSDRYELLEADEHVLVVTDERFGSTVLLLARHGPDWGVVAWPSRRDRTFAMPGAPGDSAGVREPRVPRTPAGSGTAALDE